MSGTDVAYGTTSRVCTGTHVAAWYAQCGTDVAYGATRVLWDVRYSRSIWCYQPSMGCGVNDIAYGATGALWDARCYARATG
eukprot:723257-Rhodomonas_salina.2